MIRTQTPSSLPSSVSQSSVSPDPLLTAAAAHYTAAGEALRKSCSEALITGMHLIALHARSNAGNGGGDRRSMDASGGFESAIAEIGIPKPTAYRWMNACRNALVRLTVLMPDDAVELPTYGTPKWLRWEHDLRKLADGMSLSRLMLGTAKASTEDHRYDDLLSKHEDGSTNATDLLTGVAEGRYTLGAAVKALGSQEAYEKLRKEGGEKIRKDPVYLDYDPIGKRPIGLIPKAFVTLYNGFQHWEDYDPDARNDMRRQWLEVVKHAPRELTDLLKK